MWLCTSAYLFSSHNAPPPQKTFRLTRNLEGALLPGEGILQVSYAVALHANICLPMSSPYISTAGVAPLTCLPVSLLNTLRFADINPVAYHWYSSSLDLDNGIVLSGIVLKAG